LLSISAIANTIKSAAWTPEFTRALRARPEIHIDTLPPAMRIADVHCAACNRKSHTATFSAIFKGRPYNRATLEPLPRESQGSADEEDDSDDSSDEDDDRSEYNEDGEPLPARSELFPLGSHCKGNADMAHTLRHWRYHLNTWVVDYLRAEHHLDPEQVIKRDNWSTEKRGRRANKIVEKMEEIGKIRDLYKLYKDQVDYAAKVANDYRMRGRD
jgi:hypothetical protein